MDRNKIMKMIVILAVVVILAAGLSRFLRRDSLSLTEYAKLQDSQALEETTRSSSNPDGTMAEASQKPGEDISGTSNPDKTIPETSAKPDGVSEYSNAPDLSQSPHPDTQNIPEAESSLPSSDHALENAPESSLLTGASLNGSSQLEYRTVLEEGFYYEPLSDPLRRYITGVSFPVFDEENEKEPPEITFEELCYVHILHYDFSGIVTEGELICNEYIAQDLTEIFYELYRNEYQLEKVVLIDEYNGDDNASMEANNTSCFNYRPVEGTTRLSRHALGLAIDINPLYNPYITYTDTGEETVMPASASAYADRSRAFPYKIDEEDLCYKLFLQHGFTWGGNWNHVKDYQHFQKAK